LHVTLGICYHGKKNHFSVSADEAHHHREITILTAKLAECRQTAEILSVMRLSLERQHND
jgi:hypothetical protein